MIGRAAQGRPWLFREIGHYLTTGERLAPPGLTEINTWIAEHLQSLYTFYGETAGVRIARKHLDWYSRPWPNAALFRAQVNSSERSTEQLALVGAFFNALANKERLAA